MVWNQGSGCLYSLVFCKLYTVFTQALLPLLKVIPVNGQCGHPPGLVRSPGHFCQSGFGIGYPRHARHRGEVNPRYFKTMSGYEVPEKIQVTTRHFANLLETPPLFYIAGALIIALGIDSGAAETIGWIYVAARLAHMFIHNSYNHPVHRMVCFMIGLFCILALNLLWMR
jgi:hypothetical protein